MGWKELGRHEYLELKSQSWETKDPDAREEVLAGEGGKRLAGIPTVTEAG